MKKTILAVSFMFILMVGWAGASTCSKECPDGSSASIECPEGVSCVCECDVQGVAVCYCD